MSVSKLTAGIITSTLLIALSGSAWSENWNLPIRNTPIPLTTDNIPHVQIDVEVMPDLIEDLLRRVATVPNLEIRDTVISLPGAKGFWLSDDLPLARPDAIVGGREFAHIHPDGSLHASLSQDFAKLAVEAGWAVKHPWADKRPGWEGFVMIFSAQSKEESNVVLRLVLASYNFVTGRNITTADL